jgi:hypothetical protein
MTSRLQLIAVLVTAGLLVFIFELVRRRRLMERYALLWLFSAAVLLCLAAWGDALQRLSSTIGVFYAPSAFFAVGFGFVLVLLLHFSLVVSRLVEQNKVLAQQVGQLHERFDRLSRLAAEHGLDPPDAEANDAAHERVGARQARL